MRAGNYWIGKKHSLCFIHKQRIAPSPEPPSITVSRCSIGVFVHFDPLGLNLELFKLSKPHNPQTWFPENNNKNVMQKTVRKSAWYFGIMRILCHLDGWAFGKAWWKKNRLTFRTFIQTWSGHRYDLFSGIVEQNQKARQSWNHWWAS